MSIMTPRDDGRRRFLPIPSSPTLTNPDMVLPDEPRTYTSLPSPPRHVRRDRPPSPTYLRNRANDVSDMRDRHTPYLGQKEKRGLMSRKMLLLRSRTASNGNAALSYKDPVLMDVGNLAPEEPESKWSNDESSAESEDMSGLPQFLAKYKTGNASGTDDDDLDGSTAVDPYGQPPSTLGGSSEDAERIQKEKDEQHSAILSKRAEQILANAKKRLILMEGNLRGARDLVAPLTAANLKRATSVASFVPPINNYGGINRYVEGNLHYNADTHQTYRTLHAQASNPVLNRDYQGHWRGFSETQVPERPSTALDGMGGSPVVAQGLIPTKAADPGWTRTLKGSRSHDSLGIISLRTGSRDQYRNKGSPDPNLEPLVEDEGPTQAEHSSTSSRANSRTESYRTTATPEDIHEQMSSLRGRISALKERAREENLRRRSAQNLRQPSPLNNAMSNAPELFYTSSPTYSPTGLHTRAGIGQTSNSQSSDTPSRPRDLETSRQTLTGSRNAFAEQAQRRQQPDYISSSESADTIQNTPKKATPTQTTMHRRTPSGTAVVQSSKHRYSHHQLYLVQDPDDTYGIDDSPGEDDPSPLGMVNDNSSRYGDDEQSEVGASVYEDAPSEPPPVVVAHEDREDAFDYESFFLHSAISYYGGDDARRASVASEASSDSVSTARGPAAVDVLASYVDYSSGSDNYLPPAPKTPEKLRRIEKSLHHRTFSDDSMTSFATATEGRESPGVSSSATSSAISSARISTALELPVPPTEQSSRPAPGKPRQIEIARSDSSSERADSGVGLNGNPEGRRPSQSTNGTYHKSSLSNSATLSPLPTSPRTPTSAQDPASVAVNALLLPDGRRLGLRDKALMFGLVESLKTLCRQLQEGEETSHESRMLRRRLDDARRVLAGGSEIRPGTS